MLAWLLVGVPLGAGALLACAGRRADRAAPALGVFAATVTLALAIAAALRRPEATAPLLAGIDARLAVDGLSAILVVTVAAVTLAVLLFASGEFGQGEARSRFTGLMLLFVGAMLVTVTATGLVLLLMGWEVMGATSWALIAFWWREPQRVRAANVAFLTTRGADLGLYLAAGAALAGGVGSLTLAGLPRATQPWLALLTAGIVLAAVGKSAQLPLSFWLSRAMAGPSSVSALLHSATMVAAGAYLLLRVQPLLAASGWAAPLVAWVGAATAVALGLVAVAQTDLKQLLAASTSAQVGFMVLAAGAGGVAAGTSQLVAHAATKSALFPAAGARRHRGWESSRHPRCSPSSLPLPRGGGVVARYRYRCLLPCAGRRALGEWLHLERAAQLLVVRPTMALARGLAAFDDRVLHRAVMAVPAMGLWLARRSDRRAEVGVDGAVRAVVAGARRLGVLARRPQTGQLHQYYAQAAVALFVLALLTVWLR
ncbi:MAG: hypothetical protein DLM60_23245 [Pseudonocardiales bacterium]|nr:MAG: hypothetical protein DLM60_23245 [Pseudonocardiales bacterium]